MSPCSHAPFSAVSEQTWVAVKEEPEASSLYEQQCHYVASDESSCSNEETEHSMKTISVPDELNPETAGDIDELLVKMELAATI